MRSISQINRELRALRSPEPVGTFARGVQNKLGIHVPSGIPVDFFATTPAGWFRSLVIRTGSKDFNLWLKCHELGAKFVFVPKVTWLYRSLWQYSSR